MQTDLHATLSKNSETSESLKYVIKRDFWRIFFWMRISVVMGIRDDIYVYGGQGSVWVSLSQAAAFPVITYLIVKSSYPF